MALDPLASVSDLEARGLTVDDTETAIAGVYLDVASQAVREAAGSPISETTSTVTLEGEAGQWLSLPGLPISEVTAVAVDGEAVTDWRLISQRLWRAAGWTGGNGPSEVTVTQTHGLPVVPADLVDLVCRMTAGALADYRSEDLTAQGTRVITSERIGDYAVTYSSDGRISEMDLPQYWRERLAARFGGGTDLVRSR
ncbi:hypothetical protein ACIP9H_29360 [Streptomyces sp. NPDC088732]|uniref:hypothetical protein n=1 Tax=Streptomyces sp. NPDC088732 TaxID=3365879 RepID=UPI00380B7B1D